MTIGADWHDRLIDLHSHVLPGVDDGASNLDEAAKAVGAMCDAGVHTLVATPHYRASFALSHKESGQHLLARFDRALIDLRERLASSEAGVRLYQGVELMLDWPEVRLDDPRLRLAGTTFVLVEFPALMIPPHSSHALQQIKLRGWRPIVAHPERYRNAGNFQIFQEWRAFGCHFQVNHASVVGRYGSVAQRIAFALLERGWVDYLSSDYHSRGPLRIDESRAIFEKGGAAEAFEVLTDTNPQLLLSDEEPQPVPSLRLNRSLWKRIVGG